MGSPWAIRGYSSHLERAAGAAPSPQCWLARCLLPKKRRAPARLSSLAVNFTDTKGSFVSEATVYRLLKDHGLITSPAFILMKAADRFANPTTAPNQLWQTDFTYLKVIGWGWFYLSTVLDDFSRDILAWKLCTTMSATDVSDTLQVALQGPSGRRFRGAVHRDANFTGIAWAAGKT
jgi:transposase InsO family protein